MGGVATAAVAVACLVPALAAATPATASRPQSALGSPPPTITSVQHQLGELAMQNTQLVEKYDQAQVLVTARDKAAATARATALAAQARFAAARSEFVQMVQAQYEDQSFGATGALLASDSGTNYLDRLATMDMMSARTAQVVTAVRSSQQQAASAAVSAQKSLVSARQERDSLNSQRTAVQARIARYQKLLQTLNSAQQAAYERAANPAVAPHTVQTMHLTAAGSGAAQKAVAFALAQVGKPYVYGAAGPGSYDCSGLTMAAWASAGVNLPHSAADQYNYGTHVSRADLQPGDLLFFYQPIGHVTIYIGDGYMVSAPTEGENVSVVPLAGYNADYVGATRLT